MAFPSTPHGARAVSRLPFLKDIRRIVVKVGTRVLTDAEGRLLPSVFTAIADEVACQLDAGRQVILVSSGAIASGRMLLDLEGHAASIPAKQALAAVGQSHLVGMYQHALDAHGKRAAQVLLTRDDLSHRRRYLNARNALFEILRFGVLPIVNENDTVMVEEIKFGDNDALSALVARLVEADLLILLTHAPGLCAWDEERARPGALIPFVAEVTTDIRRLAHGPEDAVGTGGMTTKLEAARIATQAGHPAVIADGRTPDVIRRLLDGEPLGTFFAPQADRLRHKKHWIAYSLPQAGRVVLDAGAVRAIVHQGGSLLPSGVLSVEGDFENGEMIGCVDEQGTEWARGISHYSAREIRRIAGKQSSDIDVILGYRICDDIIHRDELVVLQRPGAADPAGSEA